MIDKVIFVLDYTPGYASANRMIALAQEFSRNNIQVCLILLSRNDFIIPQLDNIKVCKCVSKTFISYIRVSQIIKEEYSRRSVVYLYGLPFFSIFLNPCKYHLFCEYTEIPLYGKKGTFLSYVKERIKLLCTLKCSGVFVISKALKSYYYSKGVKNIEILNMFVDNSRFNISKHLIEESPYIAYCGLVSEYKDGVDCLLKSFDIFAGYHPEYRLKIIGPFISADDELKLKKIVNSLICRNKIDFVGPVSSSDMPTLLCNASILALARPDNLQAKYGFPTKLGEYLSTGNPTVVTDVGEIHDYLFDGENIILAKPSNPQDFAEKLLWVADNYTEAALIGSRGKTIAESTFSVSSQARRAIDFINSITSKNI